jgi:hypothetical protein
MAPSQVYEVVELAKKTLGDELITSIVTGALQGAGLATLFDIFKTEKAPSTQQFVNALVMSGYFR